MESSGLLQLLHHLVDTTKAVDHTFQETIQLLSTFDLIALNGELDPYDSLTHQDQADAQAHYDALQTYQLDANEIGKEQQLNWVKEVVKVAQEPLQNAIVTAKAMLAPVVQHPSAYTKMARFYTCMKEPDYENEECFELMNVSTWG